MALSSGKVTANISGNVTTQAAVPVTSAAQTATCVRMAGNGTAQTVITVAAGTRFLLFGAVTSHNAAHQLQIYDTDGATAMLNVYGAANESGILCSAVPIRVYTAGQLVKAVDTNTAQYSLWGITETV